MTTDAICTTVVGVGVGLFTVVDEDDEAVDSLSSASSIVSPTTVSMPGRVLRSRGVRHPGHVASVLEMIDLNDHWRVHRRCVAAEHVEQAQSGSASISFRQITHKEPAI
jgi:hypothetical protein